MPRHAAPLFNGRRNYDAEAESWCNRLARRAVVRDARAFVMIFLDAALPREEAIGGNSEAATFTFFASSAARTAFNLVFNSDRIVRLRCALVAFCRMRLAVDGRFTLLLLVVDALRRPAGGEVLYHSPRRRVKWSHAGHGMFPTTPPAGRNPASHRGSARGERRTSTVNVAERPPVQAGACPSLGPYHRAVTAPS